MSIVNLASLLSHEFGAVLTHWLGVTETNFDNLWLLVTVTNLSTLLPLPLLFLLPKTSSQGEGTIASSQTLSTSQTAKLSPAVETKPPVVFPVGAVESET